MVSLFPDNEIGGEWESGYRYDVDTIRDFSHIHEWQLAGIAVMPVTFSNKDLPLLFKNYASPFSHKTEVATPGYHKVVLNRYQTIVELTASNRAGFHKYQFPANKQKALLFELGGHLGPSDMLEGGFEQTSNNEIRGYTVNGPTMRRPKTYPVYFCAVFNQAIKKIYLWQDGKVSEGIKKWNGKNGKILVELADASKPLVLMKVGISYTSESGAANNMQKEIPHWNFNTTMTEAQQQWNNMLSRIKIEGGTNQQQRRFYTDLWHAIQGRRMISDIDGKYADCTGAERKIKQLPLKDGRPAFNMYNSDAFWGAQWTLNTLWQLVYPEVAEDFLNSFLEYYKNGGLIPRGPSGGNYTYVMTGASSTPFYVSAWQKGIRRFNINLAYEGLKKNHMPGGIMSKAGYEHNTSKGGGLDDYITKGYVPYPLSDTTFGAHQDGASQTLEYAYQDWCLAQLAKALNKQDDYNYFMKRSENYKNVFNADEGYAVPKNRSGSWQLPYDPLLYEHGFSEANGAQYSWFVPHDLPALFALMHGKDSAVAKLNRQFEETQQYRFCNEHPELANKGFAEATAFIPAAGAPTRKYVNDRRTWINYSNQPGSQTAFIFNYAGAPWLTQKWSRLVVDSAYSKLSPYYGYNGDEDQGLMGSLSVLMKLGIFQMTGGCEANPKYEVGSPLFTKATITLNPKYFKAKQFVIEARRTSATNIYIQSATFNGKPLNTFYFRQSDINKGSRLMLEMGSGVKEGWGVGDLKN